MQAPEELATLLTEAHVYTHSARRKDARVLLLVGIILFLITTVETLVSRQNIFLFLAAFIEVLYFVALGYIVSRSIRRNFLITGQEGIIFSNGGYMAFSPWDNITRLAMPPYWGGYDALQLREAPAEMPIADGIREHRPAMQTAKAAMITMGPKSNSPYDIYHYIPLLFARSTWRKNGLYGDIERYAPWLLQASQQSRLHKM